MLVLYKINALSLCFCAVVGPMTCLCFTLLTMNYLHLGARKAGSDRNTRLDPIDLPNKINQSMILRTGTHGKKYGRRLPIDRLVVTSSRQIENMVLFRIEVKNVIFWQN